VAYAAFYHVCSFHHQIKLKKSHFHSRKKAALQLFLKHTLSELDLAEVNTSEIAGVQRAGRGRGKKGVKEESV
jgi:hypothetical protein